MAVQAGPTEKRYAANGVTTVYAVPFLVIEAGDLQVLLNGALLSSGYTHTGIGNPTSTITFTTAPTGDLFLQLSVPFQRLVDYQENGDFLASTVNRDYDRIWQALKQLLRITSRSPVLGVNDIDGQGQYQAKGNRLSNLADPILAQDATTKIWVDRFVSGLLGAVTGPINNALNIFYRAPNGTSRVVQDIAATDGTSLVGRGAGSLEDFLVTLALKSELESTFEVGRADLPLDRVLDATDYNSLNFCAAAAGKIRTIPLEATVAWKANTEAGFFNDSDTQLRISPVAGVSIVTPNGKVAKVTARGRANIRRITANRWHITGDLDSGKQYGAYFAYGDSITFGVGSTAVGGVYVNGYIRTLATYQGRTISIQAVAGSMVYDQSLLIFAQNVDSTFTSSMMFGTNDCRVYLDDTYRKDCFTSGYLACMLWMAVPAANKVLPNNAACTYVSGWGTSSFGSIFSRFTTTVGATVTVPFSGPVVYLNIMRTDGNVAAGEVRIDGVLRSTVNFAGPGTGTLLSPSPTGGVGPSAIRIGGLTDGPHSLELKITSVGGGGSATFLGISTPPPSGSVPRLNVMTIIRSSDSSTDARVAAYNTLISTNVAILKGDGLDVVLSDTNAVINPLTDLADTLHPNDQGHNKIARQTALDF